MSHTMGCLCRWQFKAVECQTIRLENLIAGRSLPLTSTETPPQPFKQLGNIFFQTVDVSRAFIQHFIKQTSDNSHQSL